MPKPIRLLAAALLAACGAAAPAAAVPIVFLVAEHPGQVIYNDSYVLVLEDPAHVAHARALIESKGELEPAIVIARIAAGADGLNRNFRAPGAPPWSWHVTQFDTFAENAIELCDGYPTFVEQDVDGWIDNTDGTICFWSYTVAQELPEPDAALGLAVGGAALLALGRIRLRRAESADVELLRRWDEQPHVVASDPSDDWDWERQLAYEPDWREQLVAELDGRPIGFIQIIDPAREETHYWGDVGPGLRAIDIWIGNAADLGQGHGTVMMRLALDRCFADPAVTAVIIDPLASNVRAQRFYERLGFRFVERRRFNDDDCFVYRLDRA
jgi:aminoglycoside 6'-N-acetyltransferase